MKKISSVHMLSSKEACNIYRIAGTLINSVVKKNYKEGFHIYFTTDEEIKDDDLFLHFVDSIQIVLGKKVMNPHCSSIDRDKAWDKCRKVVATTNPELWYNKHMNCNGQGCPECDKLRVPKISESFIKAYISAYNEGHPIKKVELQYYWEPFSGIEQLPPKLKLTKDGSVIWSLKEEKFYSRRDMFDCVSGAIRQLTGIKSTSALKEWFDKNYPVES